jgi:ATP-dependent Lon protease
MTSFFDLPALAIRQGVLFPGQVAPFDIGCPSSRSALQSALSTRLDRITLSADAASPQVLVVTQRDPRSSDLRLADLHPVGCAAVILSHAPLLQGGDRVVLHGRERMVLHEVIRSGGALCIRASSVPAMGRLNIRQRLDVARLRERAKRLVRMQEESSERAEMLLDSVRSPEALVDLVACNLEVSDAVKAELLGMDFARRLPRVLDLVAAAMPIGGAA